jgi:hypothetical protein
MAWMMARTPTRSPHTRSPHTRSHRVSLAAGHDPLTGLRSHPELQAEFARDSCLSDRVDTLNRDNPD